MEEITNVILHHSAPHHSAQWLDRPAKYLGEEETFGGSGDPRQSGTNANPLPKLSCLISVYERFFPASAGTDFHRTTKNFS